MSPRSPIALFGAGGRMGAAVERALAAAPDLVLAVRADRSLSADPGPPRTAPDLAALRRGDVAAVIDFSSPDGAREAAGAAVRAGCALVSGTTGIDAAATEILREAARTVPVCWSPNFSVGIPMMAAAVRELAQRLPAGWQIEITEVHHAMKRDAPSGTALRLAERWIGERGGRLVHGRQGIAGPRAADEVGVHAVRVGDVVGEHRILLGGPGETLEYAHRVLDRSAFAAGSLEAVRRLMGRGPGWYEWEELVRGA